MDEDGNCALPIMAIRTCLFEAAMLILMISNNFYFGLAGSRLDETSESIAPHH